MKTNILSIKTIVKKYMKYLCALLLLLIGTNARVWGTTGIYIEYNKSTYYDGSTITINLDYAGSDLVDVTELIFKNNEGWTSTGGVSYGYIMCEISGSYVPSNILFDSFSSGNSGGTPYWYDDVSYTSFYEYINNKQYEYVYFDVAYVFEGAGTYSSTITITQYDFDDNVLQSAEITLKYVVTSLCTQPTVTFASAGPIAKDVSSSAFTNAASVKYSGVSTGQTITYSRTSGSDAVATINSSTGQVTMGGTAGSVTITATATETATYCEASASYTINVAAVAPTLSHNTSGKELSVSNITSTSVKVGGGIVTYKGGSAITQYGFVVGTSSSVTYATATKKGGASSDVDLNTKFGNMTFTDLSPNTDYYVRAFAYNGTEYGYSTAIKFTTLQRYAITYYKNDGGATSETEYKDHGISYTISSNKYSRDHYTLSKWHTLAAGTGGTDYAKGDSYTSNAALNLYAVWQINTHSLHWYKNADDADDLTGTYTDGDAIEYGATVTKPNNPTRTGYAFSGWSETSSGSTTTPVTTMPDADKAYYAIWTANDYSVRFNENDASATGSMDNQDFTYGVAQALTSCGFSYEGHYFKGWATSNDGDVVYTDGQSVSNLSSTDDAVVDLYAVWGTYEKYVFACVDISVGLEDSKKVLITSRNGINIMAVNKLLVTTEGAVDGHIVDFSNEAGLKFYKKVDGVYKDLSVVANKLVTPLTNQEVYVSYAPTSAGTGAITIPEFTISCEGFTQTFNTSGEYVKVRNLPDAVAIVAKVGSTYHALTGNITNSTTPVDIMVSASTVEGILKANGPADLAYKLWPVKTTNGTADRFGTYSSPAASYGDRIRLAGKSDKGLMANNNASSNKYNINNSATIDATDDDGAAPYEWKITTTESDGQFVYTLQTDQTSNTRKLRMYNGRWGTYLDEKGVEELYLLPLVTTAQADMEAYEWGTSELVVKYSPAATPVAFTSITAGETTIDASATTKMTRIGTSDLWRIQGLSGLSLGDKPAEQLIIRVTENEVAKQALIQIPFLVSGNKSDYDLRSSVGNVEKVYKNTDVVILSGGKLTNSNLAGKFNDLYIYPGGKLIVESTKTMTISRLYMRGGYSYIGEKTWDVPRAKLDAGLSMDIDTFIYDLNMDAEKYYDLAVPYPAKLGEATDDEGDGDFNVWLKIYDGDNRASNGKGWTWFDWDVATPTLQPGTGYLIEATPRYNRTYCTVRFPMKADLSEGEGDKTPVAVTAHGLIDGNIMNGKTPNNVGWNFIANPYLCNFGVGESVENIDEDPDDILQIGELELGDDGKYTWNAEDAKNVRYVTIFDFESQHYEQHPLEGVVLAPFTGFFIQVGKTGTLNFANEGRQLSAPALRNNSMPRDMEIAIQLTGNGQTDETRLHINDDLTIVSPLEFPEENTKQMNANYVNIYTYSEQVSMYANGLSYDESENWNDMGVVAPSDGEYTFSIKKVNRNYVHGVLIMDKMTSVAYNLLDGDVTLHLPAGTLNERFAVKIAYGPAVATGIEENEDAIRTSPEKFIFEDKMFIRCKGVLYDATGKKVNGK